MMRKFIQSVLAVSLLVGAAACANTARGVVQDTKDNAAAVRGGLETVDVKTALIADKSIDTENIDVDTYQDTRTVVLRGSVPTAAMKMRAEQVAKENATGYKVDNQLVVRY